MILYPYGQPRSRENHEICTRFVINLGGDVGRMIDGPFATLERFIDHVKRIAVVREGSERAERPIVILTRTNPVALAVVNARRKIETAIPSLRRATWAMFVDPAEDPFFVATAQKLGQLAGMLDQVPIWTDPGGSQYLVLSPAIRSDARIRTAVRELVEDNESAVEPPTGPSLPPRRRS